MLPAKAWVLLEHGLEELHIDGVTREAASKIGLEKLLVSESKELD